MVKSKKLDLKYSDFDKPIRLLNNQLKVHLQESNQKKFREAEKLIIEDISFQKAISKARLALNIIPVDSAIDIRFIDFDTSPNIDWSEAEFLDNESDRDSWAVEKLFGKPLHTSDSKYDELLEKFYDLTNEVIYQSNLPYGWFEWVASYITMNVISSSAFIESEIRIEAIGIDADEESLYIRIDRGLKPHEYKDAWKAIKVFAKQPSVYTPHADTIKNRIILDSKIMSATEIAKKYYPLEAEQDFPAALSRVTKTINRNKTSK